MKPLKLMNLNGFECNVSHIDLSPSRFHDPSIVASKALDASFQLFIKGENTSVNMNNRNIKNTITVKIDGVPIVKSIMGNLYEKQEPRNHENERVLSTKSMESELVLYNYSIILKNCLSTIKTWYMQYFGIKHNIIMPTKG